MNFVVKIAMRAGESEAIDSNDLNSERSEATAAEKSAHGAGASAQLADERLEKRRPRVQESEECGRERAAE